MKFSNILKLSSIYSKLAFGGRKFWGNRASGILFICSEDGTWLLGHRSGEVMDGNCWGVPGGAVKEGYDDLASAELEVKQECGSLPKNKKYLAQTLYESKPKGKFEYRTFIFDISLQTKINWSGMDCENLVKNWENSEFKWFDLNKPPPVKLHFGIADIYNKLPKNNKIFTLSKEQLAEIENEDNEDEEIIIPADEYEDDI